MFFDFPAVASWEMTREKILDTDITRYGLSLHTKSTVGFYRTASSSFCRGRKLLRRGYGHRGGHADEASHHPRDIKLPHNFLEYHELLFHPRILCHFD